MPRTPTPLTVFACFVRALAVTLAVTVTVSVTGCANPDEAAGGAVPRPASHAKEPDARPLRLGTWNLEHFGQRDKFRSRPDSPPNRTPAQVEAVAAFIRELHVDVLALQEIGGPAPMRALLADLGGDYEFTLGDTGVYGDTRISVGFLWNKARVELLQCEQMSDFPSKVGDLPVFHRKPVNAVFRARAGGRTGMDFRAITVHFKASRGRKNQAKRVAEVRVLREYIASLQARSGEDQDIVVLGDFNHTYDAPAHRAFTAGDLVRYAKPATPGPTIVWFPEPIDQIALTAGVTEEVRPGSFRIHNGKVDFHLQPKAALEAAKRSWRVTYSDHFPITLDLDGTRDDDPGATFTKVGHPLPVGAAVR